MEATRPYDYLFKHLGEEDTRALLHLFRILPLTVKAEVELLPRELLASTPLEVDHVYRISRPGATFLAHFECERRWRGDLPERLAWYGNGLTSRYRIPVKSTLVLLSRRRPGQPVPNRCAIQIGDLKFSYRYKVVHLWNERPDHIFPVDRDALLPWVAFMNSTESQVADAAARIRASGKKLLAAQFMILGGLRYGKHGFEDFLERIGAMLSPKIIEESQFYKMIVAKGLEQGLERGRIEEARESIRRVLGARFPGIATPAKLAAATNLEALHQLQTELATAPDSAAARRFLRRLS